MRRVMPGFLTAVLVLPLAGCVSRSDYQAVEAQLEECRQDKQAAQQAAEFCDRRYAKEIERWDDIQRVVEEAVPQTVRQFEEERDRVLELIPQEVRQEVDDYLSNFARAVAHGFDTLHEQNEKILTELEIYKTSLADVGVRTQSIDETVTQKLQQANSERRRMSSEVTASAASIIDEIQQFDRDYISDRTSHERLKLNRNQRETIGLFHDGLVRRLVELRDAMEARGETPGRDEAAMEEGG